MVALPQTKGLRRLQQRLREAIGSRARLERRCQQQQRQLREVRAERDQLRRRVKQQDKQLKELKAQLEQAQRAAKRQAAPFARRKRKGDPKPPGQKPGHPAARRCPPPEVDARIFVPLCCCPLCDGPVQDVKDLDPQIVIDVPEPIKPRVVEYRNQSGWCAKCKKRVQSRHGEQSSTARGAAGVQIGPRALSLAMDLRQGVGIVYRKVARILELFLGIYVCAGALVRAAHRIAGRCEPTCQVLVQLVREAPVVHADETGWFLAVAAKKPWLWVFTAPEPKITLYVVRQSRGQDVPLEILGEEFGGVLVVDGWLAYLSLLCAKGQCHAHLLRRCAQLLEVQKQGAARLPHAVKRILQQGLALALLRHELSPQDYWAAVEQVRGQMRAVLEGHVQDPANRRLVKHLTKHEQELWTFLALEGVAPTNNLGEQETRPGVLLRKLSAGNRTEQGARTHEILATVSRTARRNGLDLVDVLPELLCSPDPDYVLPVLTAGPLVVPPVGLEVSDAGCQRPVQSPGPDLRLPGGVLGRVPGTNARPPPPS